LGTLLAGDFALARYPAHFLSKLTDADGENNEVAAWLSFAKDCRYIGPDVFDALNEANMVVGAKLGKMITNPVPFLIKQ